MNFHTIDPLILETLNLNEKRMNHILDILHGQKKNKPKQYVKQIKKKYSFENSLRQDTKNYSLLPDIARRNQTVQVTKTNKINQKKYNTIESQRKRKVFSLRQNKKNYSTIEKNQQYFQKKQKNENTINDMIQKTNTIDYSVTPILFKNNQKQLSNFNKHPPNSLSAVRSKFKTHKNSPFQSPSMRDLSPPLNYKEDEVMLEKSMVLNVQKNHQQKPINKRVKTKQIINDYMGEYGLKKSKSMMLNPKDIYRLEIQKLVSQLTPIQNLQDAQKKMKKIKKRHQNLKHFDQKYFSRLNEMDLILL